MSTSSSPPKIRFSTAAYAIGATPKSLRNWLSRQQLALMGDDEEPRPGWLDLDLVQVAILAVTRKLVDFGFKVDEAGRNARQAVLDPLFKRPREEVPANIEHDEDAINRGLAGLRFVCWPDPEYAFGWRTDLRTDLSDLPASAFLVVAVDDVVATALRRTREHLAAKAEG